MKVFIDYFFKKEAYELFHPESPGVKQIVYRTKFGHLLKSKDFATLSESINASKRLQ